MDSTLTGIVIVVGAINVDLVVATQRLPGPGETVLGGGLQTHGGGKGANAAVAAARMGATVHLIGAVGADDNGSTALAELAAVGIDVSDVQRLSDQPTGVALIVVDAHGENQIAVGAGANAALDAQHVHDAVTRLAPVAGCVLVSTEIAGPAVAAAIHAAATANVTCLLNPAPPIPEVADLLSYSPILTPNAAESAELAAQLGLPGLDPTESAKAIADRSGAAVVVTCGSDGALLLIPGQEVVRVPPRPADVRDTTGAGDTFNGVLAASIASGAGLAEAVSIATVAASLSVGSAGARSAMPTSSDIAHL